MEKLKRPPKYLKEVDKSLFTAEDIFDPFDHNALGTHPMTQKELLDHIMTWENIRNKAQLEYLKWQESQGENQNLLAAAGFPKASL